MSRFLRLFAAFRNLEMENARLDQQMRDLDNQNAYLRAELATAIENERKVYQMRENERWQLQYGRVPYKDAPSIPTDRVPSDKIAPISVSSLQGSMLVARGTQRFREQVKAAVGKRG